LAGPNGDCGLTLLRFGPGQPQRGFGLAPLGICPSKPQPRCGWRPFGPFTQGWRGANPGLCYTTALRLARAGRLMHS
jgi:hypothetical protein